MYNGVSEEIEFFYFNGSWLFISGNMWVDGSYMLMVKVEDKVGNISYLVLLMVVIDI